MIKYKLGFTLAEVLITLGVIGVIAVITIPTLIQNYKKQVIVNRLQAETSLIQNAFKMAEAKHGTISEWASCNIAEDDNPNFRVDCTEDILNTYLAPELKVIKVCKNEQFDDCWKAPKALTNDDTNYLSSVGKSYMGVTFLLANGTSALMWAGGTEKNSIYDFHIQLWFDIDGPKKGSARIGGDVFGGIISSANNLGYNFLGKNLDIDTLKNDNSMGCSNNATGLYAGLYCGALIQANGWKIPKDYPIK